MSKITQLTEATNPSSGDDLVEIVIDTATTPLSRKMKFLNLLRRIFLGDGTQLTITTIADGEFLKRSGTNILGASPGGGGLGDVIGPASATDEAIARYDTTTGKLIQSSAVLINNDGAVTVPEIAAPATPAAGKVVIYVKADGKLYIKDDTGTETDLTAAGGGGVNPTDTVIPYNNAGTFADSHLTRTSTTVTTISAGALRGPNGSASAPTFSFTNSTGTGFWSDNATTLRIAANGGSQVQLIRDGSGRSRLLLNASGNGAMFGFGSDTNLDAGLYRPSQGHIAVTSDGADPTPTPGTLYSPTNSLGTFGSELVVDMQLGNRREFVLNNNYTIRAPANARSGTILTIRLKQDATGSRTVTWNSAYKWTGGTAPTLSTAANAVDVFVFLLDGTNAEEVSTKLDVK